MQIGWGWCSRQIIIHRKAAGQSASRHNTSEISINAPEHITHLPRTTSHTSQKSQEDSKTSGLLWSFWGSCSRKCINHRKAAGQLASQHNTSGISINVPEQSTNLPQTITLTLQKSQVETQTRAISFVLVGVWFLPGLGKSWSKYPFVLWRWKA